MEKLDPYMQKTFAGPAAGVGQSYAWSGNKEVPKGMMTIEESVPGQKVGMTLEFVEPMESTATYALTLAGTPTGSFVQSVDEPVLPADYRHLHGENG